MSDYTHGMIIIVIYKNLYFCEIASHICPFFLSSIINNGRAILLIKFTNGWWLHELETSITCVITFAKCNKCVIDNTVVVRQLAENVNVLSISAWWVYHYNYKLIGEVKSHKTKYTYQSLCNLFDFDTISR